MEFNEHVSQDALEWYATGTLPESEIEPTEMHLLVCPGCQDRPNPTRHRLLPLPCAVLENHV